MRVVPMQALRDFQRRQFGTPPTLLGSHYNRQTHRFTSDNNSATRNSYLERQIQERPDSSVEDDRMHFEDIDIAAGSSDQRSGNQGGPTIRILDKGELHAFRGSDEYHFNVTALTTPTDVDKITPRSKAKLNILTIH